MTEYSKKLIELAALTFDWDGRDSSPPTAAALKTAGNLTVCPLGDGSLQVEMHAGGANVEILIDKSGAIIGVLYERII